MFVSSSSGPRQVFRRFFPILAVLLFALPTPGLAASAGDEVTIMLPGDVSLVMVRIAAGQFMMGSPDDERGDVLENETLHEVTLTNDYFIGKTEVTQKQWKAVMGTDMPMTCGEVGVGDNYPVYCVSWMDMAGPGGFVEKLNEQLESKMFRLPTEAEWERAARGGTQTRFAHGDVLECGDDCSACATHDDFMWYCGNAMNSLQMVGQKMVNPFGVQDMHGNLWEFVQDRYGEFSMDAAVDPEGPDMGNDRVLRGGDWGGEANFSRSASRVSASPGDQGANNGVGFRIATSDLGLMPSVTINAGFNDAWRNPIKKGGQGVFVVVFPVIKYIFMSWFTYDLELPADDIDYTIGDPGHRWYTAFGPYEGDTAVLDLELTHSGIFDSATEPVRSVDGTVTLKALSCEEIELTYEIFSAEQEGLIPLGRIADDNVAYCNSLLGQEQ
jgi:formylglycine-generating enzyme required for sulfatase activity